MEVLKGGKRVMGFEPTNGSLGSCCLTTWPHPLIGSNFTMIDFLCPTYELNHTKILTNEIIIALKMM